MLSPGMLLADEVYKGFIPFIAPIDISHTRIPFVCTAVSLTRGKSRIFTAGPMQSAVLCSLAMPMVFPPVQIGDEFYCDGGVLDKVGLDAAAALGLKKKTLVIDVSNQGLPEGEMRSGLDVMFRTEEIASLYRRTKQLKRASVILMPIKGDIHWADYNATDECIQMGYESIKENIELIRAKLRLVNPFKRFFAMFKRNL